MTGTAIGVKAGLSAVLTWAGDGSHITIVNVERIREKLRGGGFRPFAVVTSSGDKYRVPHPEFILVTPGRVVIANDRGGLAYLDPLHIVSLEELPPARNGKTRRARKK